MKKLPIFTAVLCLMALGSSVFAAIITSDAGTSGNTINEAYKPNTTPQTLILSDDVTETAVTSLNQTSTITLKSSDSTVRTISATGTDTYGPLPVFGNATDGTTINLSLNNVAVTGRLVAAGSRDSVYSNGTVNVSGSGDLTLTGTENSLNDWGGAIFGYNGVTLKDFENVTVTGYKAFPKGGALGAYSGNIEISNINKLSFQNNEVINNSDEHVYGGAICADTVSIHDVTDVSFNGNKTILKDTSHQAYGGAIYGLSGVTLYNLDSLTFKENSSESGNAVGSGSGTVSISNVTGAVSFTNNTNNSSSGVGGAIYSGSDVTLSGLGSLTFDTNKAYGAGAIGGSGTVSISNITGTVSFTNNTASLFGGAIICSAFAFSGDGSTFIFSGNTADSNPNDIVVMDNGSTISGKSTYSFGGGITGVGGSYSLSISNGADVNFGAGSITELGALTLDNASLSIDLNNGTSFAATKFTGTGANLLTIIASKPDGETAITTTSAETSLANIASSVILPSSAADNAYGYAAVENNNVVVKVSTNDTTVLNTTENQKANTIQAAYTKAESTQSVKDIVLFGDTTETGTTTLVNDTSNTSTISLHSNKVGTTRTVTGNSADPIFQNNVDGSTSNLYLGNVAFSGRVFNSYEYDTGVASGGSVNISPQDTTNPGALTFTGNGTTTYANTGGAINARYNVTLSGFDSLSYEGYATTTAGGSICAYGEVSISNVTGAVSFKNNKTLNGGTFSMGGAIYAPNGVTLSDFGSLTFDTNKAVYGGAIYSSNGVSISNVTGAVSFNNNTALDDNDYCGGGAICSMNSAVTLNNLGSLTFENNNSIMCGAIYGSAVSISNVTGTVSFKNNTASVAGGAIGCTTFAFSGDGSTFIFSGNTAASNPNDIVVMDNGSTISGKSTYSFGGGITGSGSLGISNGADVTFESGSITDLGVLTVDAAKVKVDMNGTTQFATTGLTLQNAGEFSLQDGAITTLTISGPLTVTGSTVDFDILSGTSDSFNATGAIVFTDTTFNIDDTGLAANQEYDLATGSSVSESGTKVTFKNSTVDYTLSVEGGNTLHMKINSVTPLGPTSNVPEPATWVLLALGMVGLMWGRRFTRR